MNALLNTDVLYYLFTYFQAHELPTRVGTSWCEAGDNARLAHYSVSDVDDCQSLSLSFLKLNRKQWWLETPTYDSELLQLAKGDFISPKAELSPVMGDNVNAIDTGNAIRGKMATN